MDRLVSRLALLSDVPDIRTLMDFAIDAHFRDILTPHQIALSRSIMGLDTKLIEDATYVLICDETTGQVAGCGGWSRRATLFGGDHTAEQRNDRLLDPATEPARVRAMYTHPDYARRGVGRQILDWAEKQARSAGFARVELMATPSGRPFYAACGYMALEEIVAVEDAGTIVPGWRMAKSLMV